MIEYRRIIVICTVKRIYNGKITLLFYKYLINFRNFRFHYVGGNEDLRIKF